MKEQSKKEHSKVVIVGRANVGKSTLFNRLSRRVKSMTLDYPGVTRDFIEEVVSWQGKSFTLVDTGGISLHRSEDPLMEQVRKRALRLVEQADVVLFVVDGKEGLTSEDYDIAKALRGKTRHVILVINKSDTKQAKENQYEFYSLPHDQTVMISAEHGVGIDKVLDGVLANLVRKKEAVPEKPSYNVVLLGRPNVGKSSLLNKLVDQDRAIVSDIPGTTREPITERVSFYKEPIQLVDTAGVRRKARVDEDIEQMMVKSSLAAVRDADIVVLLIDYAHGRLVDQELKLAFYVFDQEHKGLVLALNKSDITDDHTKAAFEFHAEPYEHFLRKIPQITVSAKTGKNVGKVLPLVQQVWDRYNQRFDDQVLQRLLLGALQKRPLMRNKQPLLVYRVKQVATAPITIGLQVNNPEWFGESQLKFFENILREEYDLVGVPIAFVVRKTKL